MYFYQPSQGHGLPHDPLNAIVGPRPIAGLPPAILKDGLTWRRIASSTALTTIRHYRFRQHGLERQRAQYCRDREFVWNLTTRELASAMNETSASLPHGEDEFLRAGLTKAESRVVKVPLVAQSPVNFECRLSQCIQLTAANGDSIDTWLVLGEVVGIHIDESLLQDGIYQTAKAQPVLRAGGPTAYFAIGEDQRFDLVRPDARKG
ncbi:Flavin reductase like domain [Leclercia adecarboxylata]|uniref:Flavin reductase like domain n=1 Tax=Leclercia adecarboxylata TaxID=83655 RepID=A0A4U9HMP2_9ENTR|nr:Flavin reductase like domain [Leclercia adecarboxylata]